MPFAHPLEFPRHLAKLEWQDLASVWRRTLFEVQVHRPTGFAHAASMPHRLRGAFGHALLRIKSAEGAELREALFGESVAWRSRTGLPRPFLIECDEGTDKLLLRLVLFGIADQWRDAAFGAFFDAVEQGVAMDDRPGSLRRPLEILGASWTRTEGVRAIQAGLSARLRFLTPLQLGPRHTLGLRYADIIVSLAERAAGLAVWQGFEVEPELGRWRDIAKTLVFNDDGLRPVVWERRSGAQGGKLIPMAGLSGSLDILRPPEVIMPLLALGETMHAGGGTALGLGRYEVL
jgi:hypothetical protein